VTYCMTVTSLADDADDDSTPAMTPAMTARPR